MLYKMEEIIKYYIIQMGIIIMPDSPSIKSKKQKKLSQDEPPPKKKTEHKIP